MKPQDGLYERFDQQLHDVTPMLYEYTKMRAVNEALETKARDYDKSVAMPRVSQVRAAVQRTLDKEGVSFPKGTVYRLPEYDEFDSSTEAQDAEGFAGLVEPGIKYMSRLLVVTNDQEESKFLSVLERLMDDKPRNSKTFAVMHTLLPKETSRTASIDTITFITVQSVSGEVYFFKLAPNDNMGKIIASEGLGDADGLIRDKFGYIDSCPLKAVVCTQEEKMLIWEELQNANKKIVVPEKEKTKPELAKAKLMAMGKKALPATFQRKTLKS